MPVIYLSCAWLLGIFLGARFSIPLAMTIIGLVPLSLFIWLPKQRRRIFLVSLCVIAFIIGAWRYQSSLPTDRKSVV